MAFLTRIRNKLPTIVHSMRPKRPILTGIGIVLATIVHYGIFKELNNMPQSNSNKESSVNTKHVVHYLGK